MKIILAILSCCIPATGFCQPPCMANKNAVAYPLKNGAVVYKIIKKRPPRCMDCTSGVSYMDSACNTIASFGIGLTKSVFIAEGYQLEDFAEGSMPAFKQAWSRAQSQKAYRFTTEYSFIVNEKPEADFSFMNVGDSIAVSNKRGMLHYRKGALVNSYKIIPLEISIADAGKSFKAMVYYMEPLKKLLWVKDSAGIAVGLLSRQNGEQHEFATQMDATDFTKQLGLKLIAK